MRYFSSTSEKWKRTDAGLLFSLVQVSLGWQRERKLFWTQSHTLRDPPPSHLSAATPATGIVYSIFFFVFCFFNFLRGKLNWHRWNVSRSRFVARPRPTIAANGKIHRCKYLFLEVLKKSRVKRGARSQKYIRFATSSWLLQIRDS